MQRIGDVNDLADIVASGIRGNNIVIMIKGSKRLIDIISKLDGYIENVEICKIKNIMV